MNIEIVDFFPERITPNTVIGTLHVYLPDYGVDLRGLLVHMTSTALHILAPTKTTYDIKEKKKCTYPIFEIMDIEKKKEFFDFVKALARPVIMAKIKEGVTNRPNTPRRPIKGKKGPFCAKKGYRKKPVFESMFKRTQL